MRVLIDTSVLIEAERRNFDLGRWIEGQNIEAVFVCDAGITEYLAGEPIRDDAKRRRFKDFWDSFLSKLPSLPLDRKICERAGALLFFARNKGRIVPLGDALHGAVAEAHNLHVLTVDTGHFKDMSIPASNPLDGTPVS